MTKEEFKKICREEFEKYGFKKHKKLFYLAGGEVFCGLVFQKSDFSDGYYICVFFCIGDYRAAKELPTRYDFDISSRIHILSKELDDGENYTTALIKYEEYTEEELRHFFDKDFQDRILPPVTQGKKYILDRLGKEYHLTLRKEEVLRKLKE